MSGRVRHWRCPACGGTQSFFEPAPGGPAICEHPSSEYVLEGDLLLSDDMVELVASRLAGRDGYNPNTLPHRQWPERTREYRTAARELLEAIVAAKEGKA